MSKSHIKYHNDLEQGSDAWLAARCGLLTASEMHRIITPASIEKKKTKSQEDKEKTHLYELLAQRITGYVEPHYIGDDMIRGHIDEVEAKILYSKHYAPVADTGFITNSKWGFTLGYSPDGLVGFKGAVECKSRRQKYQVETILDDELPEEYVIQVQTGMIVGELDWIDFLTYSGGLPMMKKRIEPIAKIQDAILEAAAMFEGNLAEKMKEYKEKMASMSSRLIATERRAIPEEMHE